MRVRFFGSPWPNAERRAGICDSDEYRVPIEKVVGHKCLACTKQIIEKDRGVITACSPRIWGFWYLEIEPIEDEEIMLMGGRPGDIVVRDKKIVMPVCCYHLVCWMEEVVGEEMSAKIAARMRLRPGDIPLTTEEIDGMERVEQSASEEAAEPGKGW